MRDNQSFPGVEVEARIRRERSPAKHWI